MDTQGSRACTRVCHLDSDHRLVRSASGNSSYSVPRLEAHSRAMIEFLVDSALADSQAVSPNASVALTWLPERPGERVLTLVVRMDGRAVTRMMRRVRVVPAGSPVRVP